MGGIRNLAQNVYNICSDDKSDKEVFIEAAGSSYNGVERHVLMCWDNDTLNQARVVQVIELVGIPGEYTFKSPVARLHRPMQHPDTSFFLGEFIREERDVILELTKKVVFVEAQDEWMSCVAEGVAGGDGAGGVHFGRDV
ncbi:hypothetical protein IW261DRAFT_165801 [Armillaria novae-zelandiae]|uniref:Uncharacterized protein n=1 Tax=Armillaria novae-zelandiae TaxID=153914 RepID=A0AA39UEE0_9AGAR|nr:hypothetical protein IW261DRAFT_165801 [Armillaria novae-zelandiae]